MYIKNITVIISTFKKEIRVNNFILSNKIDIHYLFFLIRKNITVCGNNIADKNDIF